jgi:O-acetyl-ADP-ribose deacetylase (regulator of RNase III)
MSTLSADLLLRLGVVPGPHPRRQLQAVLTARRPGSFPPGWLEDADRLWAGEARLRPVVEASALPSQPWGRTRVALWRGDITALRVDAIVNAANLALLGCFAPFHACIDNAIHTAAGPRLREACAGVRASLGGVETLGQARLTPAFHLPSRFVLHTVGPVFRDAGDLAPELLAACYRACLDRCLDRPGIRSLAFCSISTGVFGFPVRPAARIAVDTVRGWLDCHPGALDLVVFDVFSDRDLAVYSETLR